MPRNILAMVSSAEKLMEGIWKYKKVGSRVRLGALKALRSHLDAMVQRAEQEVLLSQVLEEPLGGREEPPKEDRKAV